MSVLSCRVQSLTLSKPFATPSGNPGGRSSEPGWHQRPSLSTISPTVAITANVDPGGRRVISDGVIDRRRLRKNIPVAPVRRSEST